MACGRVVVNGHYELNEGGMSAPKYGMGASIVAITTISI